MVSKKDLTVITEVQNELGDTEQIEAWEHDEWLLMQDMGDDYYKLHRRYDKDSEEEDPFEAEGRIEWEEEEEKAKAEYFKMIAEEEERDYYRQTVAELIEERNLATRKTSEMENKDKENDEEADRFQPGK